MRPEARPQTLPNLKTVAARPGPNPRSDPTDRSSAPGGSKNDKLLPHIAVKISLSSLLIALASLSVAQGQPADFARAEQFRRFAGDYLTRFAPSYGFSESDNRLWVIRRTSGTPEPLIVNPETGTTTPLFNHQSLAAEYARVARIPNFSGPIPLIRVRLTPDPNRHILLTSHGLFVLDARRQTLSTEGAEFDALPALPPTARTQDTGGGTSIIFSNELDVPVELFWVTEDNRRVSYGTLEPRATRVQNTFVGHVWLIRANNQDVVCFRPEAERSLARITSTTPPQAPPAPARRDPWQTLPGSPAAIRLQNNQILRRDSATATPTALASATPEDPFRPPFWLSPRGNWISVFRQIPEQERIVTIVQSSPPDQLQPRLIQFQYLKPGDQVAQPRPRFVNTSTGQTITPDENRFKNLWSADGIRWLDDNRFALLLNHRGHQKVELLAINPSTNQIQTLIEESSRTFIDWTNKIQYEISPDGTEAVWMSERNGYAHLYLYDLRTGQLKRQLTDGPWIVRDIVQMNWTQRSVTFSLNGLDQNQDPYHLHLARVSLDRPGLTRLTTSDGTHNWTFSPNGETVVVRHSRVDAPPTTELRRVSDGKLIAVIDQMPTQPLTQRNWSQPERFVAKARDGKTDIWGVIFRPSNLAPGQKLPVIENIYAGPHGAHVPKEFHPNHGSQALAELGFIVVQIDGMGTNHRGKAFHDVCFQNLADAGFPDRIAWIKSAAAKYPEMDLTRVGIYGTSAGGQNALGGLLFHGDFYKVGVSDCGCHDNRMDKIWWNEQWMGWPVGPHYVANSNVTHAKNLTGKLLLMVGEVDTNVDPASTAQVVNALIAANKDFDYLFAPNVGHGVLGTAYGRDQKVNFFFRHLHGFEPRRN